MGHGILICCVWEISTILLLLQMCFPQVEARICFWDWEKVSVKTFLPNFAIKALLKFPILLLMPRPPSLHWNFRPIWFITQKEFSKEEWSFWARRFRLRARHCKYGHGWGYVLCDCIPNSMKNIFFFFNRRKTDNSQETEMSHNLLWVPYLCVMEHTPSILKNR